MRDKLNQFVENLQGQFVEVSYREAIYQCMDLAYTWVFALGYPKATIQNLYAFQVYTNPKPVTKEYFDLIPNTPNAIPEDGDLVVWSSGYGPAGHIAIALSGGTTSTFMCFEQNNPLGTSAHVQRRNYDHVLGWLRPKKFEENTQAPIEFKDKTIIPVGDPFGNVELQALRSILRDQKRDIDDLQRRLKVCENQPPTIIEIEKEVPVERVVEKRIVLPPSSIKGRLANSLFSLAVFLSRSEK
jgi:hypothetical protein